MLEAVDPEEPTVEPPMGHVPYAGGNAVADGPRVDHALDVCTVMDQLFDDTDEVNIRPASCG
jgi:hypothetical protein